MIPATCTYALVKDLRYAVRGGRVPAWVKRLADILRVTPVLKIRPDGRLWAGGVLLGRARRIEKFARFLSGRLDKDRKLRIGIGHALCEYDAVELERRLKSAMPNIVSSFVTSLGAGIGAHGGPGTLAIAAQDYPDSLPPH